MHSAKNILQSAGAMLDQLEHAKAIKCMTDFLRHRYVPNTVCLPPPTRVDRLQICLACGGSAKRWANFLGTAKHLVDIGEEDCLLQETCNQIASRISISGHIKVLVDSRNCSAYQAVEGCELVYRNGDPEEDVAIEVLSNPKVIPVEGADLLLLMGDVCFSELAMDHIADSVLSGGSLRVFGRSGLNKDYGNTGGEIFGAYIPSSEVINIRHFYETCKKLYFGTDRLVMHRYSTWEVLALVTAAGRISGEESLSQIIRHPFSLRELLPEMKAALENGDFIESIWREINDETEDFDFPIEYISWLKRRVEKSL